VSQPKPLSGPICLADYDYPVEPQQIAQHPCEPRDACRLMRVGADDNFTDWRFFDLPNFLQAGDVLVINRTRVLPARIYFSRSPGCRPGELLLLRPLNGPLPEATLWSALGRPAKSLQPGVSVRSLAGHPLHVEARSGARLHVRSQVPFAKVLEAEGRMPLPPYIDRPEPLMADSVDYQAIFAETLGAAAAPTASLHFTEPLLQRLRQQGVQVVDVVLHVSADTFLPIKPQHAADVRTHPMHGEAYNVPAATWEACTRARQLGRQVVAVGTTVLRALETCARSGQLAGDSHLFLYPGMDLRLVNALVTNFHQPRSTLLLLVAALMGRDRLLAAYRAATARGYRFFSYGDAMFIAPGAR
jgi:S-adenosylmethionine:tRNA ribosyltransferase-isomerase